MNLRTAISLCCTHSAAIAAGMAIHRLRLRATEPPKWGLPPVPERVPNSVVSGRTFVGLCFGQSNAANFGESRGIANEGVYQWYEGRLYRAVDPMLGSDGAGGSVWTRLGPLLLTQGWDSVVFASIAIGGSEIARWAPMGDLNPRLIGTLRDMQSSGISPTHLLWHQGESDAIAGTSVDDYQRSFTAMHQSCSDAGYHVPIWLSLATRIYGRNSEPIRHSQRVLQSLPGVREGPDTDTIGDGFRLPDRTHFNADGLAEAAKLWAACLAVHDPAGVTC
jgi:Carbohydrate esterase, sialic acid-specific acetylesterase